MVKSADISGGQGEMVGDEGKPEIFKLRLKLALTP